MAALVAPGGLTLKQNKIQSLWIRRNEDSDDYSIEIVYGSDAYSVNYPKANIVFSDNGVIAFPITIDILDEHDNLINEYSLAPNRDGAQEVLGGN